MTKSWRDVLKVHPACELFPLLSKEELKALAEDIKKHGLRSPIITWSPARTGKGAKEIYLLDGRNRLDAIELAGFQVVDPYDHDASAMNFDCTFDTKHASVLHREHHYDDPDPRRSTDPYEYVLSANAHRRHLTPEQKRDVIAKVLKAQPEKSDRQIAKQVKASHHTVGAVRQKLEAGGQIAHVDKRQDTKGRAQPATKPVKQKADTKSKADAYVADQEKRMAAEAPPPQQVDLEDAIAKLEDPLPKPVTDEPFPSVRGGLGDNDIEATKVVAWFERRICAGKIAPGLVELIGLNLPHLAHLYWGENGKCQTHRLLTAEGKEKRRATLKRQHRQRLAKSGVGVTADDVPDIPEALRRAH